MAREQQCQDPDHALPPVNLEHGLLGSPRSLCPVHLAVLECFTFKGRLYELQFAQRVWSNSSFLLISYLRK